MVARVVAVRAADGPVDRHGSTRRLDADLAQLLGTCVVALAALEAEHPDQALREHRDQRGADQEGLDAHVDEACRAGRRAVGVNGAEDKVAGERRLDGNRRRLNVSNFTEEYLVGVLT